MSEFVEAIADYLETHGIAGGSTGWEVWKRFAPHHPDQIVSIFQTGGPEPEQATDRRYRNPTFQLMARGSDENPRQPSDKAEEILQALDRAAIPGFVLFRAQQSTPIALGPDQEKRYRFVVNFRGGEA